MSENCIFCKIIQKKIPSKIIYETNQCIAFLDIFPVSEGHTVIVPKKHYMTMLDIPDDEIHPFFLEIKKIAKLLKKKLNADGFNIIQNNFPAAGQVIPHFHYHIIPRFEGDGKIQIKTSKKQATEEELENIRRKLE